MTKLFSVLKTAANIVVFLHQPLLVVSVLGFAIWSLCHFTFGLALILILAACLAAAVISLLVSTVLMFCVLVDKSLDPRIRLLAAQALTGRDYLATVKYNRRRSGCSDQVVAPREKACIYTSLFLAFKFFATLNTFFDYYRTAGDTMQLFIASDKLT